MNLAEIEFFVKLNFLKDTTMRIGGSEFINSGITTNTDFSGNATFYNDTSFSGSVTFYNDTNFSGNVNFSGGNLVTSSQIDDSIRGWQWHFVSPGGTVTFGVPDKIMGIAGNQSGVLCVVLDDQNNLSGQIYRSTDAGGTWTRIPPTSVMPNNWRPWGIRYGAGGFLVNNIWTNGSGVIGSIDGLTWTNRLATSNPMRFVRYLNNSLWIVAGDQGELYTSTDGFNFTARTSQFSTSAIYSAAYGNGVYLIVGAAGKNSYSTDGETWTAGSVVTNVAMTRITFINGRFVAYGVHSTGPTANIWTTVSGTTWTETTINNGIDSNTSAATVGFDSNGEIAVFGSRILALTRNADYGLTQVYFNPITGGGDVHDIYWDSSGQCFFAVGELGGSVAGHKFIAKTP